MVGRLRLRKHCSKVHPPVALKGFRWGLQSAGRLPVARTAIVLRFFEQSDFRSVGETLGVNENAARMRVTRALEKLHSTLKRQGVTFSATALGTVLATEVVTAVPLGLAASFSATALATLT